MTMTSFLTTAEDEEIESDDTFANVSINTHISSSSRQTLVFTIRNVLIVLLVDVFFGEAKVNDVDHVIFVA